MEALLVPVLVAVALAAFTLDLLVAGPRASRSLRSAFAWSGIWTLLGALFGLVVLAGKDGPSAAAYLTGFTVEKSLSLDNLFVFTLVFAALQIPGTHHRRAVAWGIALAVVLRLAFVGGGSVLLHAFEWILYLFGAFLVLTAVRMLGDHRPEVDPEKHFAMRALRRVMPVTGDLHGERFTTRIAGRRSATPLLAALVLIAAFDLVFAVDSIPAIFAVTTDTYVVAAATIFSLLGLPSLYFALAAMIERFVHLTPALAAILAFIGAKMLLADIVHTPAGLSLGFVVGTLLLAVMTSLISERRGRASQLSSS